MIFFKDILLQKLINCSVVEKDKCWTVEVNLSALEEGEDQRGETGEIKLFSFVRTLLQFVVKHTHLTNLRLSNI